MELAGDEKKIQALFSEAALQDQSAAPRFDELWLSATRKSLAPIRGVSRPLLAIRKPLLAVTVVLLIAAAAWGAREWFWSTRSTPQQLANVSPEPVSPGTTSTAFQAGQQKNHVAAALPVKSPPNRQHKHPIHQPERPALTEAALLSRWRSPTETFMTSPATVDFNSLPQLNQSAEELKQFLPRNTEQTKESNQ